MPSKSTSVLLSTFLATSTVMVAGCDFDQESTQASEQSPDESMLVDDEGNRYQLIQNDDGTETAVFENGQSVTLQRHEDGSVDYVSGTVGLLAGLLTGYFLFHGLSPAAGGRYDPISSRYVAADRPSSLSASERRERMQNYRQSVVGSRKDVATSGTSSGGAGVAGSKSDSSAKSGFGSAGSRSSAS